MNFDWNMKEYSIKIRSRGVWRIKSKDSLVIQKQ